MKLTFHIITLLLSSIIVFSCSKDKETTTISPPTQKYPIQGLWIGTYSSNAVLGVPAQGPFFYSFIVYPDGVLLIKSKGSDGKYYYGTGNWTLLGDSTFSGTLTSFATPSLGLPVSQSITANHSSTGMLTNGTWKDTNNPNSTALSGTYSTMKRVN